ncbi:unnamed protein product, partial [Symbiodinium microadriaticum]
MVASHGWQAQQHLARPMSTPLAPKTFAPVFLHGANRFFEEPSILQAASVGMPKGALSCLGLNFLCTSTNKAAMADLQEDSVTQQVGFFQHLLPSANPTLLSQMGVKGAEPLEGAPSKHRRLDKGGKGHGNGRQTRGQKRQGQQGHQAPQQGLAPRGPQLDMRYILPLVLRMLLRQEDELQMIRLDKAFCLFVDPVQGDGCILKALYKIAKAWKDKRDQDPPQVNAPLRMIMLEALLTEMKNRLKLLSENAEAQEMAIKNQWAVRQGESLYWQFQSWDPATAKVIIHPKREPILTRTVEERIEEALILCRSEGLLHRFHATRPLSEEPKSPQAVFLLQVSLRGEAADNFHGILMTLSECAVWRVMNIRLRPEQHDIAEFASFLMCKAAPPFYAGVWQAWDPVAPYSQQDAIAAWEHDHLVRGLSECSRCIMFQV